MSLNESYADVTGNEKPTAVFATNDGNNSVMSNPMARNAMQMAQKGDSKGIEQMARNLCKEKGIDADKAFESFKSQLGM